MSDSHRVLAVVFSDSGHTIASVAELVPMLERAGEEVRTEAVHAKGLWRRANPLAVVQRAFGALLERSGRIEAPVEDPAGYDLVILACPVWAGGIPAPVRGYLDRVRDRLPRLAFLITCGGEPGDMVDKLTAAAGQAPVAVVLIRNADERDGKDVDMLHAFAGEIEAALG